MPAHRSYKTALFTLLLGWLALAMVPQPPQIPGVGLDPSWAHALNLAHAQHLLFGRDIAFTFGPLGYLFYPVPSLGSAFPPFALVWAVHALFLFGLFLIWRALGNQFVTGVAWILLSAAMLLSDLPFERMQLSFLSMAIGIVAWLAARGDAPTAYFAIAGSVAGLSLLFKTNEGLASCVIYLCLLVPVWRKAWKLVLIPSVVFVLGYVLVEHSVGSLWMYGVRSLQIAMAYSEAMVLDGPGIQVTLGICSLLLLAIIPAVAKHRRALLTGYLPALLAAFFAFKSGLVRQDASHASLLQIKMAVAALFLLVCAAGLRDRILLTTFAVISFLLGATAYRQAFPASVTTALHRVFLRDTLENLSASLHFSTVWNQYDAIARQQLDTLRVEPEVSALVSGGTVDDVPDQLDIVPGNGWRWKPRPIFQAYSAYSPVLDQLNAAHLSSPQSADHILMQWEDIDGRHPLLDDAASWRALFDHYDVQLERPGFLVLQRRAAPRYLDPQPLGSLTTTWSSNVAVPLSFAADFIMMRAEIRRSVWGAVRGLLFRNSPTYLVATNSSGKESRWRVTRANLVDGAFISLLPETVTDALPYFGKNPKTAPATIVSIRFENAGAGELSSDIRIAWYAVAMRPGESTAHPRVQALPAETKAFIDDVDHHPHPVSEAVTASANQPVVIGGWAIDEAAHRPASAVYLDVDGQLFPATYGFPRPDVAAALKDPAYQGSGFNGQITLGPGNYHVSLRILNADGTGYYSGPSFPLNVK